MAVYKEAMLTIAQIVKKQERIYLGTIYGHTLRVEIEEGEIFTAKATIKFDNYKEQAETKLQRIKII